MSTVFSSTNNSAFNAWNNPIRTLTSDPATDAGAATFVWTHAARTLTADPATDAGAATLVWTHATRTLSADPATDAGAATLVWTHATRTLSADPATDAGAATLVWAHAARTITQDPASTLSETATGTLTSGTSGSFSAWTALIASSAERSEFIQLVGTVEESGGTEQTSTIQLGSGTAGNEIVIGSFAGTLPAFVVGDPRTFQILTRRAFASGTRFAWRAKANDISAHSLTAALNISGS